MAGSGLLIVISGFSGSGKGTIMKELIARYPEEYALSISATTRGPREGEEDGREYVFKTKEEFLSMIEKGELLEYAQYVENYYGTPKAYVQEQLDAKKNVILEIEVQGALQVKKIYPEGVLIFEHSKKMDCSAYPEFWQQRSYGSVQFSFFRRQ